MLDMKNPDGTPLFKARAVTWCWLTYESYMLTMIASICMPGINYNVTLRRVPNGRSGAKPHVIIRTNRVNHIKRCVNGSIPLPRSFAKARGGASPVMRFTFL